MHRLDKDPDHDQRGRSHFRKNRQPAWGAGRSPLVAGSLSDLDVHEFKTSLYE